MNETGAQPLKLSLQGTCPETRINLPQGFSWANRCTIYLLTGVDRSR